MAEVSESLLDHYREKEWHNDLMRRLGLLEGDISQSKDILHEYINLKLLTLGHSPVTQVESVLMTPGGSQAKGETTVSQVAQDLIEQLRAVPIKLPPVDERLEDFINKEFPNSNAELPGSNETFSIDRAGVAFELAAPYNSQYFQCDGNLNIKIPEGLLANPKSDKRSTVGTFHVGESNTPIPFDKLAVPKNTVEYMLQEAFNPPKPSLELPFTSLLPEAEKTYCWTSVYLNPPVIPGISPDSVAYGQKDMEVRYFAPAAFVANIGFVEQIFANRGNPVINDLMKNSPEKHSCVSCMIVLAPHLVKITKKQCGLPKFEEATEREKRDGMCWKDENELYNGGKPFKLTYRSVADGVVISILADTYFGYSKKEIKTMISFACNIRGFAQEEHAGGCYVCPEYSWARSFNSQDSRVGLFTELQRINSNIDIQEILKDQTSDERPLAYTFEEMKKLLGTHAVYNSEKGYLQDRTYKNILYMPEYVDIELSDRKVTYKHPETGEKLSMMISAETIYTLPNGYELQLKRHPVTHEWMIVGTVSNTKFLFKPASVSGSGKSELSKSIMDAVEQGPFFCKDFDKMMRDTEKILDHDYSKRFAEGYEVNYAAQKRTPRPILSQERTIGSVIELLTPEEKYTEEYNNWLHSFDKDIIAFVFILKSFYRPSWGDFHEGHEVWESKFSIDKVNGANGYALKCQGAEIICNYLRVGMENGQWRQFRLREDFFPAVKFQNNDDIGVALTVPGSELNKIVDAPMFDARRSYKMTSNCEYRYFQRPDDACHPGVDKKCENDLSIAAGRTFISNFEPIPREQVEEMVLDVMSLEKYSENMQQFMKDYANSDKYASFDNCVISSEFRITDPAKNIKSNNVRYLQTRDELLYLDTKVEKYCIEIRNRLARNLDFSKPVPLPVDVYVPGRRLNTVDPNNPKVRPLAVYGPIHYEPIPLLVLDFMTSMSGKSPSTTGSGSLEGALTKGPFNNLLPAIDINYFALTLILTTDPVLTTAAGNVGHELKIDHDITLMIPDILSRMSSEELKIENLIRDGFMEKVDDIEYNGQKIHSSILGYRITERFVKVYFARIFDYVSGIFTDEMLRPEKQSLAEFVDGVNFIYENIQGQVANYYKDGSFEQLIPPLQTLLNIVKNNGSFNGLTLDSPAFLQMFERENVMKSLWYKKRLVEAQRNEIEQLQYKIEISGSADLRKRLEYVRSDAYLQEIDGSIGVHVFATEDDE